MSSSRLETFLALVGLRAYHFNAFIIFYNFFGLDDSGLNVGSRIVGVPE